MIVHRITIESTSGMPLLNSHHIPNYFRSDCLYWCSLQCYYKIKLLSLLTGTTKSPSKIFKRGGDLWEANGTQKESFYLKFHVRVCVQQIQGYGMV